MKNLLLLVAPLLFVLNLSAEKDVYWMKIPASTPKERSEISDLGISIDHGIFSDYVIAFGSEEDRDLLEKSGKLEASFLWNFSTMDFPADDSKFHNFDRLQKKMIALQQAAPEIVKIESIGKTRNNKDILNIHISGDLQNSKDLPGVFFVGAHHAREHLSTEVPLQLAEYLISEYQKSNPYIVKLLNSRDINIVPMLNVDGVEYDIKGGNYKLWRKNRTRNKDGTYGVDLNRNYSVNWGLSGASEDPSSDIYMGPEPFSEPETLAVKNFIDAKNNITMLVSFHSFSELILYPWGSKYESISNQRDFLVHKTIATTMSKWNGYTPMAASALYLASGDTVDWAYGTHRIVSFTFELDPKDSWGSDGFYPGEDAIDISFRKNLKPCLYVLDLADNPYRAIESKSKSLGFMAEIF